MFTFVFGVKPWDMGKKYFWSPTAVELPRYVVCGLVERDSSRMMIAPGAAAACWKEVLWIATRI